MEQVSTIVWDWNGTLLNDVNICIETINELLKNRKLPLLNKEHYLDVFGFPVRNYYQRIGFDFEKEPFEIPAHQYIDLYYKNLDQSGLHSEAIPTLNFFKEKKFTQVLLSASEQEKLDMATKKFGINNYFKSIAGLDNHYATSKVDIGKLLLKKLNKLPEEVCMIGDTTHDAEVAQSLGCKCVLVAKGHQSNNKLKETGQTVVKNLSNLEEIF